MTIKGVCGRQSIKRPGLWFIFNRDKMLVSTRGEAVSVPFASNPAAFNLKPYWEVYVGLFNDSPCYSALVNEGAEIPPKMQFQGLRGLFGRLNDAVFGIAGRALQLVKWDYAHQYCSRCGRPAGGRNEDGAQICLHCGYLSYPRISPAVIVAVLKEDRILLAHNNRFPKKRYSVIAGYVEMGETLEGCVRREIREEVGIEVKNIRYFGSQSWAFTSSLMVAFTADYAGGEISVDTAEIEDAGWFAADSLPDIPDRVSIARKLIDWFVQRQRQ
ncbi:MAG: NAD(+) diphosphatase [Deltaproteobacteria bacterium]|nr:NAD(+) diphosphatase [Deltaproteobacteria bacterium]MBW1961636.1 NAD(+) diphosphatase [Deltaproteobacteria bacterium]MBW1993484.1 NAD(+) diphosphatase [Deltaproteobacteria bacterium]MBW2151329.1 NAD(+) diphosphatase [Deltaproteobacteria bacterium]